MSPPLKKSSTCAILEIHFTAPTLRRVIKDLDICLRLNSTGEITDFSDEYLVNGGSWGEG